MSKSYTGKACRSKKCRTASMALGMGITLIGTGFFSLILMTLLGITNIAFWVFFLAVGATGAIVFFVELAIGLGVFATYVVVDEVSGKLRRGKRRK